MFTCVGWWWSGQAKFDGVVLGALQITGGGDMEITGLDFRVSAVARWSSGAWGSR